VAAAAPAETAPAPITDERSALFAITAASKGLAQTATALRALKPESELSYRLTRAAIWLPVTQAPPNDDGVTRIPPPPPHIRQHLEQLASQQSWQQLLHEAENASKSFILWLDLQRFTAMALEGLGDAFAKASQEVVVQLALFLHRVPNMSQMSFMNGTPFADAQTKMWIEMNVLTCLGGEDASDAEPAADDEVTQCIQQARKLATKGDLDQALTLMNGAAMRASSPSKRFRIELACAKLCLAVGQYEVASSQLDALAEKIEQHDLKSWEPELCTEVYAALFQAHRANNDEMIASGVYELMAAPPSSGAAHSAPMSGRAAQLAAYQKLCRLDPVRAIKLREVDSTAA
jgi:type VI secretion system protein VasJ